MGLCEVLNVTQQILKAEKMAQTMTPEKMMMQMMMQIKQASEPPKTVCVGDYSRKEKDAYEKEIEIEDIFSHEDYNGDYNNGKDFALLYLAEEVIPNECVQIAQLPT